TRKWCTRVVAREAHTVVSSSSVGRIDHSPGRLNSIEPAAVALPSAGLGNSSEPTWVRTHVTSQLTRPGPVALIPNGTPFLSIVKLSCTLPLTDSLLCS